MKEGASDVKVLTRVVNLKAVEVNPCIGLHMGGGGGGRGVMGGEMHWDSRNRIMIENLVAAQKVHKNQEV